MSHVVVCDSCKMAFEYGKHHDCRSFPWVNHPKGKKLDDGKARWDLLPFDVLGKVVDVLTFGAKKYGPDNWQHVENPRERYFAAAMRHLFEWKVGWKDDTETSLPHLAHAICCIMFLMWFDRTKKEESK